MTHAEIQNHILDTIKDYLIVATKGKFIDYTFYEGIKFDKDLIGEEVYVVPLKDIGKDEKVDAVLNKLKEDKIIGDYTDNYVDKVFDHYEVVLSKIQVEFFGQTNKPLLDFNTGYLIYRNKKCKFERSSKQFLFMKLLYENQGKIVDIEKIGKELWPNTTINPDLKINIYDTYRKINEKLKKCSIEDIFLESNSGYGLKD